MAHIALQCHRRKKKKKKNLFNHNNWLSYYFSVIVHLGSLKDGFHLLYWKRRNRTGQMKKSR
jgi:hypothetical protein